MNKNRIMEITAAFPNQQVLVVGDLILDRFIYGKVSRISPEAPVPVVKVTREANMPGGASNVARNVKSLGARASVGGFLGDGHAGQRLLDLLNEGDVATRCAMVMAGRKTTVKTRIIAEHQQVVRVDLDADESFSEQDVERFCRIITAEAADSSGIIIEDYGKGVVSQALVDAVIKAGGERGIPVGYDPKDNHELDVHGVTLATPNRTEAFSTAGIPPSAPGKDPLEDAPLRRVADGLMEKWHPEMLLITLGSLGMLMQSRNGDVKHIPTRAREVFDVSGAGDTVIGTCLLAIAAGASHEEAAELANYAAGVVVAKLGTAMVTIHEILHHIESVDCDSMRKG